ncbi:hypothetical protein PARHAE_02501 [Paracoccus haematequi]|uniref:Uncharacterized protein n=1 Tax=Paracoccus haematequi TaxID=2491866 RepID=A0A3S4GRR5_9RHOB|nr:hypothetical protein [Paracoccus haematequi]VDS09303.1 hypothetical protein PARHAE_02501 [Paracoccus haematequi]
MKHHRFDSKAWERKRARDEQDARRGKLGKGRFDALVVRLVGVIKLAFEAGDTGSMFGLEGPLRHGIRSDLCLQGWRWQAADDMARELLADAFRMARAIRPGWDEGQPDWTIHAGTLIERTLCVRCKAPLPERHFKFCSDLCASAHFHMMADRKQASEDSAYDKVVKFNGRKYAA